MQVVYALPPVFSAVVHEPKTLVCDAVLNRKPNGYGMNMADDVISCGNIEQAVKMLQRNNQYMDRCLRVDVFECNYLIILK